MRKGWPVVLEEHEIVRSAGGVVSRLEGGRLQIVLVHRTKQNDWSFPKGRLENDEAPYVAALREVFEETSCICDLSKEISTVRYMDRNGNPKEVRYWRMTVVREIPFVPNAEINKIEWLSFSDALRLLTYKHDRMVLKRILVPNLVAHPAVQRGDSAAERRGDSPAERRDTPQLEQSLRPNCFLQHPASGGTSTHVASNLPAEQQDTKD